MRKIIISLLIFFISTISATAQENTKVNSNWQILKDLKPIN